MLLCWAILCILYCTNTLDIHSYVWTFFARVREHHHHHVDFQCRPTDPDRQSARPEIATSSYDDYITHVYRMRTCPNRNPPAKPGVYIYLFGGDVVNNPRTVDADGWKVMIHFMRMLRRSELRRFFAGAMCVPQYNDDMWNDNPVTRHVRMYHHHFKTISQTLVMDARPRLLGNLISWS